MFEAIHLVPLSDSLFIQWDVVYGSSNDLYIFDIFLSNSPNSGFVKINDIPIINGFSYTYPMEILFNEEYIFVKVGLRLGDVVYESLPQGLFQRLSKRNMLVVKEIVRNKDLIRRIDVGVKCLVFKRRTFGALCKSCIDSGTGYIKDSRCSNCFGTRILGGFFDPIEVVGEHNDNPVRSIKSSEVGTLDMQQARFGISYPVLQKGDIILEVDRNLMWYVNDVSRDVFLNFPVDQSADVRRISAKDIEYSLLDRYDCRTGKNI